MFKKIKEVTGKFVSKVKASFACTESAVCTRAHEALDSTVAEAYVDTGVKILIAVVIGALLLAGLYTLFNTNIMPTVSEKVADLFDYAG